MPLIDFDRWSVQSGSKVCLTVGSCITTTIIVITSTTTASRPRGRPPQWRYVVKHSIPESNHPIKQRLASLLANMTHTHTYIYPHPHQATAGGLGALSLDTKEQEQKEKMTRMRELTNADEATARFWLESWAWDLERVRTSLSLACMWVCTSIEKQALMDQSIRFLAPPPTHTAYRRPRSTSTTRDDCLLIDWMAIG